MRKIITLSNIQVAIQNQIIAGMKGTQFEIDESDSEVPKGVIFTSTDITEEITRPSIYIKFENNKSGLFNKHNKERTVEVSLYYFAKERENCKLELLEMEELLENIFLEDLKVSESFFIPIEYVEFDSNKKDGFLIMSMELYTIEELEDKDTSELMEQLTINNKINGGI